MKNVKPVVIFIRSECSDALTFGYPDSVLGAYIRHFLNCDVLFFDSPYDVIYKENLEKFLSLYHGGLIVTIIVEAWRHRIEGTQAEYLYQALMSHNVSVPFMIRRSDFVEDKIVEHPENPLFNRNVSDEDVIQTIERITANLVCDQTDLFSRLNQLEIYNSFHRAQALLLTTEEFEYSKMLLRPDNKRVWESEADIIRGLSDEGRIKLEECIDLAQGYVKAPNGHGVFCVRDHAGMGPDCASFAANSLTRDIFLSDRGRNHAICSMKMNFLCEGLAHLIKHVRPQEEIEIEEFGGYVYYDVGDYNSPILILKGWDLEQCLVEGTPLNNVCKFVRGCGIALPIYNGRLAE